MVEITLKIPTVEGDKAEVESLLREQTQMLVALWRGVLADFKTKGFTVPTLTLKGAVKSKEKDTRSKELLEHVLKHMPSVEVAKQVRAIGRLLEAGFSVEELIERFDKSCESYPLTTWLTVAYWIKNQKPKQEESEINLSEEQKEDIKKRLTSYAQKS